MLRHKKFENFSGTTEKFPCVYHLLDENNYVLYIGSSTELSCRLSQHRYAGKIPFTKCRFFRCSNKEMHNLEAKQIFKHYPPLNSRLPTNEYYIHISSNSLDCKGYNLGKILEIVRFKKIKCRYNYIRKDDFQKVICNFNKYTHQLRMKKCDIYRLIVFLEKIKNSDSSFKDYDLCMIKDQIELGNIKFE